MKACQPLSVEVDVVSSEAALLNAPKPAFWIFCVAPRPLPRKLSTMFGPIFASVLALVMPFCWSRALPKEVFSRPWAARFCLSWVVFWLWLSRADAVAALMAGIWLFTPPVLSASPVCAVICWSTGFAMLKS